MKGEMAERRPCHSVGLSENRWNPLFTFAGVPGCHGRRGSSWAPVSVLWASSTYTCAWA